MSRRRYLVQTTDQREDHPDDWVEIEASTEKLAAQAFCEWYNANAVEYPSEREVRVKSPYHSEVEVFAVECVPMPTYIAKRKK